MLISYRVLAQEHVGAVYGIVRDVQTGRPLKNVIVKIEQTTIDTISNPNGVFWLSNVPVGSYHIKFIKTGYQNLILSNQFIQAGQVTLIRAEMIQGTGADVFYIGGIEITAEKELLPQKVETVTSIKSSDIEHIQAISLGDILDLVPGVEMKNQPSLNQPVTAMIRDPRSTDILTAFGARIIIDDIPISNNANLQGPLLNGIYTGTANGIDLREIPADNIELVEVIRGIAPANHGDYVGGLIDVKTKARPKTIHRLKGKNNPDTRELNLGGSFHLAKTDVSYNLNWGYSEKDIRKDYDNTQRLVAQLIFKNSLLNNLLAMKNQLKYSKLFEEVRQHPDDPDSLESTNRGYRLIYGNQLAYTINPNSDIKSNLYINYHHVNSSKQYRKIADNRVCSTLMEPGTMIGIKKYGPYTYRYKTLGEELTIGHEIEWHSNFFIGKYFHSLKIGNAIQYDDNFGEGRAFNVLYPSKPGDRPRSFDEVPGAIQHSIYLNDQITGKLWKEFTLNLGLRLERYTTGDYHNFRFFKSNNGAFLNPRINLAYYWNKNTQIRLGYGRFSKSPGLSYIYPDPFYLDVPDIGPKYNETDTLLVRDSLITTYVFKTSNPNLKGYQEEKIELSIDHQMGDFGCSLTGFYSKRSDEPVRQVHPFLYYRYYRPEWPSSEGVVIADTVMEVYHSKMNGGWSIFDGVEFTLNSRRIKRLNMDFSLSASYQHVKSGSNALNWGQPQADFIIPIYSSTKYWTQKLVITYQANYIAKALGIWVSLTAQQVPHYQHQRSGLADSLAVAYYDGLNNQMIQIPEHQRLNAEYTRYRLTKDPIDYMTYKYPNKWIFNIRISKSLFRGAEVSMYVNNFLDNRAIYEDQKFAGIFHTRNPEIFYGIELSMMVDNLFRRENL